MKIAQLPDGTALGFPDNAHDDAMDRAIQGYLGISQQKEAHNQMEQQFWGVLIEQFAQLTQSIQEGNQASVAIAQESQALTAQAVTALTEQIGLLSQSMTAPKKIIRDESGSPVGVVSQ